MSCEDLAFQRLISRWSAHIVILHKPPTDISAEAPVLEESQAFCALALPLIPVTLNGLTPVLFFIHRGCFNIPIKAVIKGF